MNSPPISCEINGRRYRFINVTFDSRFNTYYGYCPKLKKHGTVHSHNKIIAFDDGTFQKCTRIFT